MTATRLVALAVVLIAHWSTAQASDWLRFRGPNGSGISLDDKPIPAKWNESENLKWKSELPGPGVSSPIVVGERVFVTCYSGYGLNRSDPGEIKELKRHLVCINADTGKAIWDKAVDAVQPEDPFDGIGIPSHGYASHTPVSDGEHVYVFFGKSGALAFDMEGEQVWQTSVGTESDPWGWGSASSPVLYNDKLIVTASAESQALVALDTKTGEEVWRQEASGFDGLWGTPSLVQVDGRTELVLSVPSEVWGFNPDNGKLRWYCAATESDQAHSSAVVEDGVVYAITGRGGGSVAVRAGGKGDVTDSQVVWIGQDSARFGSPVLYGGRLYLVTNGTISAIDAKTGQKVVQTRLEGGSARQGGAGGGGGGGGEGRGGFGGRGGRGGRGGFGGSLDYPSPVIADGKLFYLNGSGQMFVIQLGEELEQLAVNKVTDDSETFGATPAISNGRLFVRSNKHLYCVSATAE
jgi:hypothetical protein